MRLTTRFSLVFLIFVLIVLGLFSGTYYLLEQHSSILQQRRDAQAALEKVASICREAKLARNWISAVNQLKIVHSDPAVLFSCCLDEEGKAWAHSESRKIGLVVATREQISRNENFSERSYSDEQGRPTWEVFQPIRLGKEVVGTARIGYDEVYLTRQIRSKLLETLHRMALVASFTMVFALLAAWLVAWTLARPIQALVLAAKEVKKGNLTYQSPIGEQKDELGELAGEFNSMVQHLRRLDDLKAEFISNVSHDLRSPMSNIIIYANHLLSGELGKLDVKQGDCIEIIRNQCQRLTKMVDNILDVGKLQAGVMTFLRQPFALGQVAEEVRRFFEITAKNKEIALKVEMPADLPLSLGDSEKVNEVFTNLVSNALNFTDPGGSVTLGAQASKDAVQAFVRDTGVGIPPQELSRMFERFHQLNVEEQRAKKIHGTGLGLAICKGFVEGIGGTIWVESKLGQGTTFYFTLPQAHE